MKLRRDSAVAMHRQLAQQLRGAIALGTYKPGDRLPGEQRSGVHDGAPDRLAAEHVQDANSLAVLWQSGVNFIQGYYLQKPDNAMTYDFTSG